MGLRAIEKAIEKYVVKAIAIVAIAILLLFMLLTVADVAMRYLFNHPLLGSMEIIKTSMVMLSFLVLGWTTYEKGHVRLDTIIKRLPKNTQRIMNIVFHLLSSFLMTFMTYSFIKETIYRFDIGEKTVALKIPVYVIYGIADIGLVITSLVLVLQLLTLIAGRDETQHES
jgi:TRAP-type C4-dicarboxylate transport system permease small subunit